MKQRFILFVYQFLSILFVLYEGDIPYEFMSAKAGAPVLIIPWAGVAGAGWAQCRVTQPGPATLLPAAITTITHRSYTPLNTYTHTSHTVQWHVSLDTDSEDPSLQRCQRNFAKVFIIFEKGPYYGLLHLTFTHKNLGVFAIQSTLQWLTLWTSIALCLNWFWSVEAHFA